MVECPAVAMGLNVLPHVDLRSRPFSRFRALATAPLRSRYKAFVLEHSWRELVVHTKPGPTLRQHRSANLDVVRGCAALGMFYVSAIAYGLPHAAFFNLQSPGTNTWFDWIVAFVGELLFDQKAMVLMALVYGACIVHFARSDETERDGIQSGGTGIDGAEGKWETKAGRRWSALRRALIVFALGVPVGMHGLLWEGTPLFFFGFFTPILLLLRKRSVRLLTIIGTLGVLFAAQFALDFRPRTPEEEAGLGQYWFTGEHGSNDIAGGYVSLTTLCLFMAVLILGVAIGRLGWFIDDRPEVAARMTRYGLGIGLPLTLATMVWRASGNYEPSVAIVAETPNTVATVPMALGYVGLISRWRTSGALPWLVERIGAVGQMALTNTAAQTLFGIFVLRDYGFGRGYFSRGGLVVVVVLVWAVQLVGSKRWLERFHHGPLEWVLRLVTYRRMLPLKR